MSDWKEFYKTSEVNKAHGIFYQIYSTAISAAFPLKQTIKTKSKR